MTIIESDDYTKFLKAKVDFQQDYGFDIDDDDINPILMPHQRAIVKWAVKGGRRAIFAAFGLGKSVMQLETVRLTIARTERQAGLIICPLGVRQEFKRDAEMLGLQITFIRRDSEIDGPGLYLTNYESVRDGKLTPTNFDAVSLDEASVLRSFGSKTFIEFLPKMAGVPARFVATATPAPNRFKELIHYAGFLGVMDTGQALTRFFKRDSTNANNLTLHPHKVEEFWLWLATWSIFLQKPSELGFDDTGYDLPPLTVRLHEVELDGKLDNLGFDNFGQGVIVRDGTMGVTGASKEKRASMPARVAMAAEIVNGSPDDHFILWHHIEDERRAIAKAIPGVSEVYGSLDLDERERRVVDFSEGRTRLLATKPVLSGSGCNFQRHCHRAIFVGVDFKFNDFIQAVHRIQRFQQPRPVIIDIIHADTERSVVAKLMEKWEQHKELTANMSSIIKQHGLSHSEIGAALQRSLGVDRVEASGEGWMAANNDCVKETVDMDEASVDLVVTSIPFSNHYEYTPSLNDFGHTDDNDHFWAQMDYLTPQLLRILGPGRIYACHVKDRILFGNQYGTGASTVSPFHAEAIMHGQKHGFDYMGMITVVTDVVRENNQTYRLGWSEQCKDSTKMGVGSPEYVLLFRKPQTDRTKGYADDRVEHDKSDYTKGRWQIDAHAFWRSSGDRPLLPEEISGMASHQIVDMFKQSQGADSIYNFESHLTIAEELDGRGRLPSTFMQLDPSSHHPDVWSDITRMHTLNGSQAAKGRALHICLAEGSLVLTREHGHVPIEDVVLGSHVLTHKGRWKPVMASASTGVNPTVTIKAQGVPGLRLTPGHRVWAKDSSGFARARYALERAEAEWVEAKDLTSDHYVNLQHPSDTNDLDAGDDLLWWTVGRWIADGHIDQRGCAIISCGRHESDELANGLGRFGGNKFRDTGTALQIQLKDPGRQLRDVLDLCGKGAGGKRLPAGVFELSDKLAAAILEGYLSGDGHLVPGRERAIARTVSKSLAFDIALLAQRVHGVTPTVIAGRPDRVSTIEGREVSCRQEWVVSFPMPRAAGRRKASVIDEGGSWKKVRSVVESGETTTWNLRVADDHSYTAEGMVVKNCPLQFDIVDRLIERFSMPGELVFDPFGGLMTVPLRALKLGRKGRASELNPGYFLDGVKYLEAAERELAMPSLFDAIDGLTSA